MEYYYILIIIIIILLMNIVFLKNIYIALNLLNFLFLLP